jgi:hypothetical protein
MQAFLTEDAYIHGLRYRAGSEFTFGEPMTDGRYHLIFDLPTGKETVLTALKGISYQLISDTVNDASASN